MANDTEIMPPVELGPEVGPWNIAKFSTTIREQIVQAARREGCSVADWLHGHFVRFGVAAVKFDPVKLDGLKPAAAVGPQQAPPTDAPGDAAELASLLVSLERLTAMRGVPQWLRHAAEQAIVSGFDRLIPAERLPAAPKLLNPPPQGARK